MQESRHPSRCIVPDTRWRDLITACVVGALMLLFVGYAVVYFSREARSSDLCEGIILHKTFVPRPETQITFGQGGLDRRQSAGEYSFRVRVPQENGREYTVPVDASIYGVHQEGDRILFRKAATVPP